MTEATVRDDTTIELVTLRASAELATAMEASGLRIMVRAAPSAMPRGVMIAYDDASLVEADRMAIQCRLAGRCRVVLLRLFSADGPQIGSECSNAHMRIGVAHPICALLVRLCFRTCLPLLPTLEVARVALSVHGPSAWWAMCAILEGAPEAASLKQAALLTDTSRWTLRRRLRETTGLNPRRLMTRIRGTLALGMLTRARMSLSEAARVLGSPDLRSLRRSIDAIVDRSEQIGRLSEPAYCARLYERALERLQLQHDCVHEAAPVGSVGHAVPPAAM